MTKITMRLLYGVVVAGIGLAMPQVVSLQAAEVADTTAGFDQAVLPFLQQQCLRCHGPEQQKGELRIDTLSRDFAVGGNLMQWDDVAGRLTSGEMPPDGEPRPPVGQPAQVAEWLRARLKEGEALRLAARERVTFHKLTRSEYANTLYDLLGIASDVADRGGLPEDPQWHGFERIGAVLSVSPAHIEKYLIAAQTAIAEALPDQPVEKLRLHWGPLDMRGALSAETKKQLQAEGRLDKLRLEVWPGVSFWGHSGAGIQAITIPTAGQYRCRIKLSGLKPADKLAPHVSFYCTNLSRQLFEQDVIAPEDQPVTLEFQTHLPAGQHTLRTINDVPGPSLLIAATHTGPRPYFGTKDGRDPWQIKLTDEQGQPIWPFLIVDWVEWEGPLDDPQRVRLVPTYSPPASGDLADARQVLAQFVERAFRRPASSEEVERFVELVKSEMAAGETFPTAFKSALISVLCSSDFLYLVEGSAKRADDRITDWELASRLSYFLTSTMPDAPLIELARAGKLHERAELEAQLKRLLADPRSRRFAEQFSREWLQLRLVGMFPPDKNLYPDYNEYLQSCLIAETTAFFREVLEKNLSLREFLNSDWTMLNARLAAHYQIAQVTGDAFTRVGLRTEDHRGGLLTQAAILTLTSDGTRHRPVHRGKWLLESILGKSPPPPPANVKPIESTPPSQPKATLRAKLAAHKSDVNCAACHRNIDPLGLAFDNYDAIGRWRTEERVTDGSGANPPIDASGELADGRKFANAAELKVLLAGNLDKFNAALVEKLATYALRRAMTVDDRRALADLADQSKAADYRLVDLLSALVLSDLFQKR